MTNEEMHRTMEFIVEQQVAANIQRLREERIRDNPRLARFEESFQPASATSTDYRYPFRQARINYLHPRINHLQPRIKYGSSRRGTDSHR
jgi:hypothetical protein